MIERLIENWLDKSTERTFQKPFCYMLSNEGYRVVHLTRHNELELGKDILAIAPDGVPCAFQLKTAKNGRITIKQWQSDISNQLSDLVEGTIIHPSIDPKAKYKAFLVTNGELDEPVIRAIEDRNVEFRKRERFLEVWNGHKLLEMSINLGNKLWPKELKEPEFNFLINILNEDGRNYFPKQRFARLIEFMLFSSNNKPKDNECKRLLSSIALFTSITASKFSTEQNYIAEIEAWTIYIAYLIAIAERYKLKNELWIEELDLAEMILFNSFSDLCEEIKLREDNYFEGLPLFDQFFYKIRITQLISFISVYGLWRISLKYNNYDNNNDTIKNFIEMNQKDIALCHTEANVPQIASYLWYQRKINYNVSLYNIYARFLKEICKSNNINNANSKSIANPYYSPIEILNDKFGFRPIKNNFVGLSWTAESLIHLLARNNIKNELIGLWKDITYIHFCSYKPDESWKTFLWRNTDSGKNYCIEPKHKKQWSELQQEAAECEGKNIPKILKDRPYLLLLFTIVYPHRFTSEIARFLDEAFKTI